MGHVLWVFVVVVLIFLIIYFLITSGGGVKVKLMLVLKHTKKISNRPLFFPCLAGRGQEGWKEVDFWGGGSVLQSSASFLSPNKRHKSKRGQNYS